MRKDQQVSFGIYVMVMSVVIAVAGGLLFLFGEGPAYLTADQIGTLVATQPAECQPIARARLRRRLVQENVPLRMSGARSVLREIDAADCSIATMQLKALDRPNGGTAG